jgi:hypothetical protein
MIVGIVIHFEAKENHRFINQGKITYPESRPTQPRSA